MSSLTPGSPNSARYLDFDEYVELKLQKTGASIKTTDILIAAAGVATMFLGYLLTFIIFDQWVVPGGFGIGLRWTLLATLLVLTVAWLTWKVGIPYLRTVNRLFAAREIEAADPQLRSNLLNLVDLRAAGREVNPAILRALEKNAAVQLQKIDVTQAIDHRPLMRMAYVLLVVVVLFCLYALFSPKKISNSIWRSLFPAAEVGVATRTEILKVDPGDVTVMAREVVEIVADIAGEVPEKVWLHYTTADGRFQDEPVEMRTSEEGPTRFHGRLYGENGVGMLQDTTYVVSAGDAVSSTYRITVNQPPSANVDKVAYRFEPYMKLEPTEQAGGNIDGWEGATVTVSAHTNIPVKSAEVRFLDTSDAEWKGEEESMSVSSDGLKLSATWKLSFRSDGTFAKVYQIQCQTESGATDPRPTQYTINIRPDLPPEVALLEPVRDLEVAANAIIPLLIEARDPDFELSHINLHIKKNGQAISKQPLSDGRQQRLLLKHEMNLDRLVLKTGDVVEFWVQAFDNKQPRPNASVTPELKLKIVDRVTDREVQQQLAEDRVKRDQQFEEAQREQNGDRAEQQPPKEAGPTENRNEQDPKRPDPMPNEQPENDPEQGKSENASQDSNSKQPGSPDKRTAGREDKNAKSDSTQEGEKGKSENPSLSPDGEDDQSALKEVLEKFNQDKNKKPPKSDSASDPQGNPGETQSNPKTGENGGDPKSPENTATKKPTDPSGAGENEPGTNAPGTKPGKTPKEKQPGTEEPGAAEEPDPKADPKPDPKADPMSDSDSRPGDSKQPNPTESNSGTGEKPAAGKEKKPGDATNPGKTKSSSPDQANTPKAEMPGDGDQETSPEKNVNEPQGATKPDAGAPKNKAEKTPGAGTKPEKNPNGAAGTEEPGKSGKPSEEGTGAKPTGAEKPGPGEPDPKSPMKEGTKNEGTKNDPNGTGTDMPTDDSPGAKPEKATGDETGNAKPDRDPKSDATRAKNPNELKRDPNEKPETRPSGTKPEDAGNPSKTPSESTVKPPKPTGPGQEKIKQEQDPDGDKGKGSNKDPEQRPADPNGKNEELKGPGEEKQRSKTGSGGEEGGSKEDKNGKAGSPMPGEGSETERPGQNPGKPAEKDDSAGAKPGSGKEGDGGEKKPGGKEAGGKEAGGKEAGGKEAGGKEAGGKEAGGKEAGGKEAGGKEAGGKEAGGKEAGGKEAGGKEAGGKPGQGGTGGQGGNPQGGNGPGKQGPRGPANAENVAENDAAAGSATDDGEEANLEYKRQATELVLKKLQKDLERGEVDPELLEKLGWTEDEMKRFADRISKHLQESKSADETPESQARKVQFEEMLKSLDLNRKGTTRSGENSPAREVNQIDTRRGTVPKEYRSVYEKFSRDATRQKKSAK